ncbi:MAG: hypothetical protein ACI4JC_09690 [Faecalibacterium sp.]
MNENEHAHETKDYSRYMGTLNRIYGRGSDLRSKKLDDGIDSLKKGGKAPARPTPADGRKDHSFWVTLGMVLAAALVIWLVKTFLL